MATVLTFTDLLAIFPQFASQLGSGLLRNLMDETLYHVISKLMFGQHYQTKYKWSFTSQILSISWPNRPDTLFLTILSLFQ
jgi:hypothetical protein